MLLVKRKLQLRFNPVEWNNNRYTSPYGQITLKNNNDDDNEDKDNNNNDNDEDKHDEEEEDDYRKHYYDVNWKNSIKYAPHGLFSF